MRALLGVKKVTQDNPKGVWNMVPIQDFTEKSDIDWSVSIANIDKQFYKKYGLSEEEMSNFLFQNISNIFGAPKEVIDIITKFEPIEEPKNKINLTEEVQKDLSLDKNGEVSLSDEFVIGRTQDVFGNKIYDVTSQVQETMTQMEQTPDKAQKAIDKLKEQQVTYWALTRIRKISSITLDSWMLCLTQKKEY